MVVATQRADVQKVAPKRSTTAVACRHKPIHTTHLRVGQEFGQHGMLSHSKRVSNSPSRRFSQPLTPSHPAHLGTSCKKSRHHRESESKTPDSSPRHGHPVPTRVPSCAKTGCVTPSAKAGNNATSGNARIAALIRESFPQSQQCWSKKPWKRKNLCFGVRTHAYI